MFMRCFGIGSLVGVQRISLGNFSELAGLANLGLWLCVCKHCCGWMPHLLEWIAQDQLHLVHK